MIRGGLLTRYYLDDGIRAADAYRRIDPVAVGSFATCVRSLWGNLQLHDHPNEAETEQEFIVPVIDALGWHHLPQQQPGKGRRDIADMLLFLDDGAKDKARRRTPVDRFGLGAIVVENEARDTRLDRAGGSGETPASQILRYLIRADSQSDGAVRWGLLTNGRLWRLYSSRARARAEGFVEIDLPALVGELPPAVPPGADPDHWLRVFLLLFGRAALVPAGPGGQTFLDEAVAEGRRYEQRVTAALSGAVFDRVFPDLVAAIGRAAGTVEPAAVRDAALILLYRLLFLLYAEDRDLLPLHNDAYREYSMRRLRDDAAGVIDADRSLSPAAATWWPRLTALFGAIAGGDAAMALPPYNGGLFEDGSAKLLRRVVLPDAVLAPLIDALSREPVGAERRWINYRDLSVQQLGSIYERLLEQDVVPGPTGLTLRPAPFARKTSGSYYTPDELVQLILRRAVGPLLEERRQAFRARAEALGKERGPKADRLRRLAPLDPAMAFIGLRVCDPAMGSGHFLVSLVDYLADEVLTAMAAAPALVAWAEEPPYRSPLAGEIEKLRANIRAQASAHGWPVPEHQLDDRHLVRRIILKRVIYGVDLNPMAVELAKLSLWLHSFTVGAPLSFLDHHLRCGDSLFGEFVHDAEASLRARGRSLIRGSVVAARNAAKGMSRVESLSDADLAEVRESASTFATVEEATAPLCRFLDLLHAERWLDLPKQDDEARALAALYDGLLGDPVQIAAGAAEPVGIGNVRKPVVRVLERMRALAAARRFLHWEVAFPGVWDEWERQAPPGGFDAVIGNPPWDRMKMQEVEWFAARVPAIARAQRASDRKRGIAVLRKAADSIVADYDRAAWVAEAAAHVARKSGVYPLLSSGDINVYSLFVERAARLAKADGIVGLLTPSGIAADLGAAKFFRGISTTGRLAALLDFENRRTGLELEPFFPDVDSRFKFCALVFGGRDRTFARADCAFFQQDAVRAEAAAFPLAPADFRAVNPNTGTSPVFRSRRDAEITRAIYRRLPVLVDRSGPAPRAVWPVRYHTMFHMTNDSAKFRTAAELTALGAYRVAGGAWEKGTARWLPLMVGRSIHIFDHRAASVIENSENLHNPFHSALTTDVQHADASYVPTPQFWISEAEMEWPGSVRWVLAFRDIARPTDVRTVIAGLAPKAGFGNTLPLLLPTDGTPPDEYHRAALLLAANLCSFALDYVARQKVQSTHLNFYIVEQLPVIPPASFAAPFGSATAEDIIRHEVLRLTYTAHDMTQFARDQGFTGPPFTWDEEDRLRRRARLDAVFFHLYGLDRDAADYILSTFPIVKREEVARWGRFRSRDLILGYMAALAAGAPDAAVAG